jgi:hypothetical protein
MKLARLLPHSLFVAPLLGLVALNIALLSRGLSPSLSNPDEGGHYVNALFLGDWIRAGFPSPMAFAQDYYAHFPRLSIGHWPPGWYMLEAPFFALFRPSPLHATVASAFVAGLPGFACFWAMQKLGRLWLGLGLAIAYVFLPLTVDCGRYILLDQPVALVVAMGAIAWKQASDDPRWWRFLLFAALAAYAPLVKGNGALIALVPALHILVTGRWALLRQPWLWIAAALTLAVVAPWYWLSFKISAGGFNYAPGLAYASIALSANSVAIWANLGIAGIALAAFGAYRTFRGAGHEEAAIGKLAIAVILATLIFQSAIPASTEPRYISPLLPWLVLLIGLALIELLRASKPALRCAAPALAILALIPAILTLHALPPKPDSKAPDLGKAMTMIGGIWMVDGRAGDEGALIASAAWNDNGAKKVWVTRASQWLSTSDFMGRDYVLTAKTPADARAVLDRIGAAGVISIAERRHYAYPHSRLLDQAVSSDGYAVIRVPFETGDGIWFRAIRLGKVTPNVALIEQNGGSANVAKMKGTLD